MSFSQLLSEAVRVRSKHHDTLAGLAPAFIPSWDGPTVFEWQEGGHRRAVEVQQVLRDDADRVVFETTDGDLFSVERLTLALYEREIRAHTVGQPKFQTETEMVEAMRLEW